MGVTIAAYTIAIDEEGCRECGKGATWIAIGPDGVGGSTTYEHQGDAQDEADLCNRAFAAGIAYQKTGLNADTLAKRTGLLIAKIN